MSQEVEAVTAAKYVNEVTVGGVTRYQACVHGCSSDVRDTHHEAVKDARRMLQSATVTAVMKGDMPKPPAAVADAMNGASSPLASTVARLKADLEAVTKERDAVREEAEDLLGKVEALERERADVIAAFDARGITVENPVDGFLVLDGCMNSIKHGHKLASGSVSRLNRERDEARAETEARHGDKEVLVRLCEIIGKAAKDHLGDDAPYGAIKTLLALVERLDALASVVDGSVIDERDAFALAIARLVSKT